MLLFGCLGGLAGGRSTGSSLVRWRWRGSEAAGVEDGATVVGRRAVVGMVAVGMEAMVAVAVVAGEALQPLQPLLLLLLLLDGV